MDIVGDTPVGVVQNPVVMMTKTFQYPGNKISFRHDTVWLKQEEVIEVYEGLLPHSLSKSLYLKTFVKGYAQTYKGC
ncbi:MAG TPA: hypothetical protein EYH38_02130 [Leucothrix sp.]|nr:hypothetical protein [Leucothrix sp.]